MSKDESKKSGMDPQVWIALIGLAGLIVTSIIAPIVMKKLEATPTPTVEVVPSETTGNGDIPNPTVAETVVTVVPTSPGDPTPGPGDDWANNCIDKNIWQVFPASARYTFSGNCIQPPAEWGIVFTSSGLTFINPDKLANAYYGFSTPIANDVVIKFTLGLSTISQGEMRIGFTKPGFGPEKYGIYLIPKTDGSLEIVEVVDGVRNVRWQQQFGTYPQKFTLEFPNGFLKVSAVDKDEKAYSTGEMNNIILPPNRNLFVGFESFKTSFNILGFITNLSVTP